MIHHFLSRKLMFCSHNSELAIVYAGLVRRLFWIKPQKQLQFWRIERHFPHSYRSPEQEEHCTVNCSRGCPLDPEPWRALLFLSTWRHVSWFVLCGACLCKTLRAEPKVYLLEKRWNVFFPIQTLFTVMVYGGMITVDACCHPAIFFKACFSRCASKRSHLEALHEQWSGWSAWTLRECHGAHLPHFRILS